MPVSMVDDPRTELASIAASLRAYLEWQGETGAVGFPRGAALHPDHLAPQATPSASAPYHAGSTTLRHPAVASATAPSAARGTAPAAEAPAEARDDAPIVTPTSTRAEPPGTIAPPAPSSAAAAIDRHRRLVQVAEEVSRCTRCGLAATRTQTVFARGNPEAQLCLVGEGPGAEEDAQGVPFVGRAGQLLDRMIGAMGLSAETDVYICNIVKCRPPGNRRPEPEEVVSCMPYLHEQLALVRPRVIVALGNTAAAALLDTKLGITKLRGQWKLYRGKTLVMPTYHPSYLLRPSAQQAEAKRQTWADLQLVMRELGLAAPQRDA